MKIVYVLYHNIATASNGIHIPSPVGVDSQWIEPLSSVELRNELPGDNANFEIAAAVSYLIPYVCVG